MTTLEKLKRLLGYDSVFCVDCVYCRRRNPLDVRRCDVKYSYRGWNWVTGDYINNSLSCEHGNPNGKCLQFKSKTS